MSTTGDIPTGSSAVRHIAAARGAATGVTRSSFVVSVCIYMKKKGWTSHMKQAWLRTQLLPVRQCGSRGLQRLCACLPLGLNYADHL